ncbi:MAG: orotidine-5'-phosphate decarboxylase [Candidatus Micrarchaeia archaeon]
MQDVFRRAFIENAKRRGTNIILALDTTDWNKAQKVLTESAKNIAAVKVHPEYADLWGFSHESAILTLKRIGDGVPVILDAKIADIDRSNAMKAEYYLTKGYDAIICHGFSGEKAVESVINVGNKMKKGVFVLVTMTSPDNLFTEEIIGKIADMAGRLNAAGVIAPGNQYEMLSSIRKRIGEKLLILSPGIGAQGGDAEKAFKAGANFAIVGRKIVDSQNPGEESLKLKNVFAGKFNF